MADITTKTQIYSD